MGLLRSFGLGGEVAVVYVTFAHQVGDGFTAGVDGKFGKVDGVGTHVGYQSGFVQTLRHHHGLCHGEAQFAGSLLLQGRGGERGCGSFLQRTGSDVADGKRGCFTALQQFPGFCLCLKPVRQFGFHFHCFAVSVRNEEYGGNTVGCFGLECMYLAFALYNETDGYGLYTACRKGRFHFLPQYR